MSRKRVMVVDDERSIRETRMLILRSAGYDVLTAENGFDALLQLRTAPLPEIIISDLNMPHMSGFEFLSVVRRRFPQISVIASSGAYRSGDGVPGGIIADAFHAKQGGDPSTLLDMVARLLKAPTEGVVAAHVNSAPVWIPLNGKDSRGIPFVVVTCPECLRSFPLEVTRNEAQDVQEAECLYCPTPVKYVVDFSRDVISPKADRAKAASHKSDAETS